MGQVTLRINGRSYDITCDDGQEDHLREVGAYFDSRVRELVGAVGQVGESRLLVIAGLLVADELFDAKQKAAAEPAAPAAAVDDAAATRLLEDAASRVDALARKLERA